MSSSWYTPKYVCDPSTSFLDRVKRAQLLKRNGYGWQDVKYLCRLTEAEARAIIMGDSRSDFERGSTWAQSRQ